MVSDQFTTFLPRSTNCVGWSCFTPAEQFGIILSSILAFLVICLAYMYCLGRAFIFRRTLAPMHPVTYRDSVSVYRHRNLQMPRSLGLDQAHQTPVFLGHQTAVPLTQTYVYHGVPLVASTFHPNRNLSAANEQQPGSPSPAVSRQSTHEGTASQSSPLGSVHDRAPHWRQLVTRAFRLPVGKAYTIQSESTPPSPGHSQHATNNSEAPDRAAGLAQSPGCDRGHTDAESIETSAATVHSDDFQVLSPPSSTDVPEGMFSPKSPAAKDELTIYSRRLGH